MAIDLIERCLVAVFFAFSGVIYMVRPLIAQATTTAVDATLTGLVITSLVGAITMLLRQNWAADERHHKQIVEIEAKHQKEMAELLDMFHEREQKIHDDYSQRINVIVDRHVEEYRQRIEKLENNG